MKLRPLNRKKALILMAVGLLLLVPVLYFLLCLPSGYEVFDFIDSFNSAQYKDALGKTVFSQAEWLTLERNIDLMLSERSGRSLPEPIHNAVNKFLSWNEKYLARRGRYLNGGIDNGKGGFAILLNYDYKNDRRFFPETSENRNDSITSHQPGQNNDSVIDVKRYDRKPSRSQKNTPVFEFVLKSASETSSYTISLNTNDPPRIEIAKKAGNDTSLVDSFYFCDSVNDALWLYILFYNQKLMLFTNRSILTYFKTPELGDDVSVKFSASGNGALEDVKSVRFKRITGDSRDILLRPIHKYHIVPDDNPRTEFAVWNELEFEDRIGELRDKDFFLRRMKLFDETRRAIVLFSGDELLFRDIRIPDKAVFEAAIAAHPNRFAGCRNLRFILSLRNGKRVLKKYIKVYNCEGYNLYKWQDIQWDLSEFSGKKVDILLKTKVEDNYKEKGLVAWGSPVLSSTSKTKHKNVILISLDTLRADHLGCYGYHRPVSPVIDRWASRMTLFKNSISNSSWTLPSHISILTSLYPQESGVEVCANTEHINNSRLAIGLPTLATYLRLAGYKTYAIVGGGYVSASFGFDRGFNVYKETPHRKDFKLEVNDALDFLRHNRDRKFFLFLHTFEIHAPYRRSLLTPDGKTIRDKVIADYDSGIMYTDRHLKHFLTGIEKLGLVDNTVIILTSDHGEMFDHITDKYQYGTHGHSLNEQLINVPLVIGGAPEFRTGKTIETLASGVDIMPTVLDYLDIDYPQEALRGRSLLPLLDDDGLKEKKVYAANILGGKVDKEVLRSRQLKMVRSFDVQSNTEMNMERKFYDIKRDPNEKRNLKKHPRMNDFLKEISKLRIDIYNKRSLLKKWISSRGKYRNLLEALNIGGYVSPKDY